MDYHREPETPPDPVIAVFGDMNPKREIAGEGETISVSALARFQSQ